MLYKATRHGFRSVDFHRRCDYEERTVTIIKSTNGYLFGGYIPGSWSTKGSYQRDPQAFLFTLINPYKISPRKFVIKTSRANYAFYNHYSYGPTFGGGHDIRISDNSDRANSYINFGNTYTDTTSRGQRLFTGNTYFLVSEIEVYQVY